MILKEQIRVIDAVWHDVLQALRYGRIQPKHLDILESMVLDPLHPALDFAATPWCDAPLITPRHAVRTRWNAAAARKMCASQGARLWITHAEDRVGDRELTLVEREQVALRTKKASGRHDLPWELELAVGVKVLVTDNLETDLDLTNGARGTIVDIVLHPDEDLTGAGSSHVLEHIVLYLLVKMERTRAGTLPGLEPGVIPWSLR